jgi:phage gp36-like protein
MAYSTRTDIERVAGADNVARWADVNNDGNATTITNAITAAIEWADEMIDGAFRDGPYVIPFSATPTLVARWSAKLAAVELYRSRGLRDDGDSAAGKLTEWEKQVNRDLMMYTSGSLRLEAALNHDGPTNAPGTAGPRRDRYNPDHWTREWS